MAEQVKQYEVVTGLNHPDKKGNDIRRDPGDVVAASDLPKGSVEWLLADGHLKEVK